MTYDVGLVENVDHLPVFLSALFPQVFIESDIHEPIALNTVELGMTHTKNSVFLSGRTNNMGEVKPPEPLVKISKGKLDKKI